MADGDCTAPAIAAEPARERASPARAERPRVIPRSGPQALPARRSRRGRSADGEEPDRPEGPAPAARRLQLGDARSESGREALLSENPFARFAVPHEENPRRPHSHARRVREATGRGTRRESRAGDTPGSCERNGAPDQLHSVASADGHRLSGEYRPLARRARQDRTRAPDAAGRGCEDRIDPTLRTRVCQMSHRGSSPPRRIPHSPCRGIWRGTGGACGGRGRNRSCECARQESRAPRAPWPRGDDA
jgi:hypothetical protein